MLHAQRVLAPRPRGTAVGATLSAIEHLGYIQIDTISVIQRAHHHVLWSRNPRYQLAHLDQLLEEKQVFEYWSHAAAFLPMRAYRFSLPRKNALASGEQSHWFKRDEKMETYVLDRIAAEGPLMAKDFEHGGQKKGGWGAKPAKQALETLFMQGDLMIPRRVNFHKVYDLTERVVPDGINTTPPTREEHARHLIIRYLEANGLGRASEMAYLLKNTKPLINATLKEMVAAGEVSRVDVVGSEFYMLPASMELLDKPLARGKLKILSPFDNVLIQRKRMKDLFGFEYQIECYVPAAKRTYGYFVLPIIWNGTFAARMDCKVDRKTSTLHLLHLVLESGLKQRDEFLAALDKELQAFMAFNGCVKKTAFKKVQ